MSPAPWDSAPSQDIFFVLVTGANSGIGFGIAERLIDEFLTTRSLTAHLVLIPTTRSEKKSALTVGGLREHAKRFASTSEALRSRAGPNYDPKDTTRRVHVLSIQLDLCKFTSIRQAADQLVGGTLTSYSSDDHFESLVDVRIPRLDAVIFNAGIGGWTGLNWPKVFHNIFTAGLIQATTWPTFKASMAGHLVKPLSSTGGIGASEVMGEVFCANVFGHYLFAHYLLPLLSRKSNSSGSLAPGRIIWESSIEPVWENISLDDFQAIKSRAAYESTKRLTDILSLTATLPGSQPYVQSFLQVKARESPEKDATIPPKQYLIHPGVVQTTLFPLNAFLFFWYRVVLYISRWLGSPWHNITPYNGACAPVWLALEQQEALDAAGAELIKWGSSTDRAGNCRVKKTEVEGWGWDGRVEDRDALLRDAEKDVTRKKVGRKAGAVDLTQERRVEFEAVGAECWQEMERLREEWEARMDGLGSA
ncbi:hypothetical protein B0H66DRAFT_288302 [Apodospora peruviana]|uniref:3-keto-steroid reductase n=1 Tax=Apodospora peruviana TaxID=516989 RepID=A0AAE0I0H8_9PEZI|nr:hypothetical protein B0H66DRAFT_288302 [Apodospora peruviana]